MATPPPEPRYVPVAQASADTCLLREQLPQPHTYTHTVWGGWTGWPASASHLHPYSVGEAGLGGQHQPHTYTHTVWGRLDWWPASASHLHPYSVGEAGLGGQRWSQPLLQLWVVLCAAHYLPHSYTTHIHTIHIEAMTYNTLRLVLYGAMFDTHSIVHRTKLFYLSMLDHMTHTHTLSRGLTIRHTILS